MAAWLNRVRGGFVLFPSSVKTPFSMSLLIVFVVFVPSASGCKASIEMIKTDLISLDNAQDGKIVIKTITIMVYNKIYSKLVLNLFKTLPFLKG